MARITTEDQHYQDIAAAIREKHGVDTRYKPEEMAAAIAAITAGMTMKTGSVPAGTTSFDTGLSSCQYAVLYSPAGASGKSHLDFAFVMAPNRTWLMYYFSGAGSYGMERSVYNVFRITGGVVESLSASDQFKINASMQWIAFGIGKGEVV